MSNNISSTILTQLANETSHWLVDFVEIKMSDTDSTKQLRLSSHYTDLVVGGETYVAAGQLMSIGSTTDNIEATDDSLSIGLSGIDSSVTAAVLSSKVPGSEINIYRGFFNEDTGLLYDNAPYLVWSGIASSYSITDTFDIDNTDAVSIQVEGKSLLSSIMDRQSGVYTSVSSYQTITSSDKSMEFVAGLTNKTFNFGKED